VSKKHSGLLARRKLKKKQTLAFPNSRPMPLF